MAESNESNRDSHRSCAICLEDMTLRTPRALSCLHSFCSKCLEELPLKTAMTLECPICRKETTLQKGGIKELPENFYLKVEKPNIFEDSNHCEQCTINLKSIPADLECQDCSIDLCRNCDDQHLKQKIT